MWMTVHQSILGCHFQAEYNQNLSDFYSNLKLITRLTVTLIFLFISESSSLKLLTCGNIFVVCFFFLHTEPLKIKPCTTFFPLKLQVLGFVAVPDEE